MGTKRPFDEELQEFIKHPKHFENGNRPDSFGKDKQPLETSQNVEIAGDGGAHLFHTGDVHEKVISTPDITVDKPFEPEPQLPPETGISGQEEPSARGFTFCSDLFPEFFEFNMPRQQLVHYDDTYTSLLNCSPRKEVPVGPEHQADVPEFDPDSSRKYISNHGEDDSQVGVCVISNIEHEIVITKTVTDCNCSDGGSVRCVQQHVNEARLNLKESLGLEKFIDLGFGNMGEEVACNWTEEEEQLFQGVVYSNPVSHGKRFWEELKIAFPTRSKKELISYYFNVFILRRRAVQNRSQLLAIDSDDDEWWGTKRGSSGVVIEDQDFVVVGPFVDHQDHDFSSEAGAENGITEGGIKDGQNEVNVSSSNNVDNEKVTNENEQEKPVHANNNGLRSESYLHWDPPYSTMGPTKGVDLLPTCSMIEEIFGSSKTGKNG